MFAVDIAKEEALRRIRRLYGLPPGTGHSDDVDLIAAEYLRTLLVNLGKGEDGSHGPVYVTRLTNAVRRQLAPLWPQLYNFREKLPSKAEQEAEGDLAPDRIRRVLERLQDMRDVMELGDGYWMPTPVRLVSIPNTDRSLVVGGLGTSDLHKRVGSAIEIVGLTRMVRTPELAPHITGDKGLWQSFGTWCGEVPLNVQEWAEDILAEAGGRLAKSAAEFTSFEVYAPWLNKREPQYFRWIRFDDLVQRMPQPLPRLVLCRSIQSGFSRQRTYWLGAIDQRALRWEAPIAPALVRRLAYGLDLIHEAPTQARWNSGVLMLRNWLPPEEQRALLVFGRDVSAEPGRLPLRIDVASEWQEWVAGLLRGLGIDVGTS